LAIQLLLRSSFSYAFAHRLRVMAMAAGERLTQFREHRLNRWQSESDFPEQPDDLRFPSAVNASPSVALEATHS
jgi:hypothetical protein